MKNLKELLEICLEMCRECDIPYRNITEIKLNNRLSKTWGRCLTRNHSDFWIEIQAKFAQDRFSTENQVIEVICHEIIHTCEGCWNHGAQFLAYGQRLTEKYGIKVSATGEAEELTIDSIAWKNSFRYLVKCPCGQEIHKDRMCDLIRYPSHYVCGKCKGTFERIK